MSSNSRGLRACSLGVVLLSVLLVGTAAFAQTNTAYGSGALQSNTSGFDNSAFGFDALFANTEGAHNTATGSDTLLVNTFGNDDTATGHSALASNTTGGANTATGAFALTSNNQGALNTADGDNALYFNTLGSADTANGYNALVSNTTGTNNTATGLSALNFNTEGNSNTAIGTDALYHNTVGGFNIALGYQSGFNVTTGNQNIEIGSQGTSSDDRTIRLGSQGTQTATYIAGIRETAIKGADVVVSSSGQLGITKSSARCKRDIQPLSKRSQGLWQLRPVAFRYRQDPTGEQQYGLIAEEVAKVYPELVVRGDNGEAESVQYRELIPLMLNEMQRQRAALTALWAQNAALEKRLKGLERTSRQRTSTMR